MIRSAVITIADINTLTMFNGARIAGEVGMQGIVFEFVRVGLGDLAAWVDIAQQNICLRACASLTGQEIFHIERI